MFLIFYDIEKNNLRKKIADLLLYHGYIRIQQSVFVGIINPDKFQLWRKIDSLVDSESHDKVYCLKLTEENFRHIKIIGTFDFDMEFVIGRRKSIVF